MQSGLNSRKSLALVTLLFLGFFSARHTPASARPRLATAEASLESANLFEDFEDGAFDPRISLASVGVDLYPPAIRDSAVFGSSEAFGFGRSSCNWGCQNRLTSLKITYPEPVHIYSISFKEMELFGNWGNGGKIYLDGVAISPADTRELGREPYNDQQPDTTYRTRLVLVDQAGSEIEFRVSDITSASEIYLDDLVVSGACLSPPGGLAVWWSGDGHPFDLLGENHARWFDDQAYSPGVSGKAFSLDGIDDFLEVGNSPLLQGLGEQFSVEAWIQPLSLPSSGLEFDQVIVERSGVDSGFALATHGDRAGLWIGTGSAPGVFAGAAVTAARWTHIVGTYDGAMVRLYLDGELRDSQLAAVQPVEAPLFIGAWHGSNRYFQGALDEVSLYGRALEPAEVLSLYTAGSAGKCRPCLPAPENLAAWYPMDEGSGELVRELAGAYNGLLEGAGWVVGKRGAALSFDGLDDALLLPQAVSQVLLGSGGTLGAWVNPSELGGGGVLAAFGGEQEGARIGLGIDGQVRIHHNGATFDWQTAVEVPAGSWTYLAYTWTETSESLYKNGELGEWRPRNFSYAPGQARIGAGWWDVATSFSGMIDEIEVYNRPLPDEEIAALYAAGCAGKCWQYTTLYLPLAIH